MVKTYIHQIFEDIVGPWEVISKIARSASVFRVHGFDPTRGKETDWLHP